ncbi:hypothetical protein [Flavobacterium fluviatile]|uniref:hypothetical protein n=1 Tax=Flavobacterium fluviatile TaxID=1862387 RepID=UPI0013D47423|nr:hypothetical protein [Flavobacterium fluviatile]
MKICLISFDYWGFDYYIIEELKKKGIEASHINLNDFKYTYSNVFIRIANGFSKVFLNKNIKRVKKQNFVLNHLEKLGHQDIILTIRPDLLDRKTHKIIKTKTNRYIAYLYDSIKRFPVKHLSKGIFDDIFSFDREECNYYNFKRITNYIYLPKKEIDETKTYKNSVFIVMSKDERLKTLNSISQKFDELNIDYKFIVKSNKNVEWLNSKIEITREDIGFEDIKKLIEDSKIMMDISRSANTGLSFRFFESLAYQKKIITTNQSVKKYAFYDPNNILVINPKNPEIPKSFFETEYKPLSDEIYNKYTINNWVKTVFGI